MNAKIIQFKSINKEEKSKMESLQKKAKVAGKLFGDAFLVQMGSESTLTMGVAAGLHQGLKYNGSVKRGVKAAAATMGVMCALNGVLNVYNNIDVIKETK